MRSELSLKVMTFNIRHAKGMDNKINLDAVAWEIHKSQADLVALQEVDRFMPRSGFQDQARSLANMLNMQWCFSPSLHLGKFQYGNAVLSRYPIVESSAERIPGIWEKRSILTATINIHNHLLTIVNTHLGVMPSERKKQFFLLMNKLNRIMGTALVMGDFNMRMGHQYMQ
ncbi:MAG: hypothetical protein A2189_01890 [Paenibacillus sp. RIFOXYA1_FULL_44_5]|nr:MAG: hypothetical protein A2189_01890 [Paenibacillus sp. RIFOXYA1_FULL_44_5]